MILKEIEDVDDNNNGNNNDNDGNDDNYNDYDNNDEDEDEDNILTREEFYLWLKKINCNVNNADRLIIFNLFDNNKKGKINIKEILKYIGLYPRKNRIDNICIWISVCHICGMNRGYDYNGYNYLFIRITEMKDHIYRRNNKYIDEYHKQQIDKPKKCEVCKTTQDDKIKALKVLEELASKQIKNEDIESKFIECERPSQPIITYESGDIDKDNKTSTFTLKWRSTCDNILFFILEKLSPNSKRYEEICKDPPNSIFKLLY